MTRNSCFGAEVEAIDFTRLFTFGLKAVVRVVDLRNCGEFLRTKEGRVITGGNACNAVFIGYTSLHMYGILFDTLDRGTLPPLFRGSMSCSAQVRYNFLVM